MMDDVDIGGGGFKTSNTPPRRIHDVLLLLLVLKRSGQVMRPGRRLRRRFDAGNRWQRNNSCPRNACVR